MKILVCELVPSMNEEDLDIKINQYNSKLNKWGESNGISIIETNLNFRLGTGEVNEMCFREDGIFLNRLGVIRLLTTISKKLDYFKLAKNWKDITRNYGPSKLSSQISSNQWDKPFSYKKRHSGIQNQQGTAHSRTRNYRAHTTYPNSNMYATSDSNHINQYNRRFSNGRVNLNGIYQRTEHENTTPGHTIHHNQQRREGCFNCGERNHRSDTCRYDHKIRCTECHQLGHKNKFCSYFSR